MARHFTRYGRQWEYGVSELDIELWCFKYAWPEEKGGLGRYGHAKNAINLLWNYKGSPTPIIWTPWIERMIETACKYDVVIMGGGSSSGKSLSMAIMATLFYLADPVDTLCLVTSTTIEGAKKRIFKDIKRLWRKEFPGKLVDGKGQIKGVNEDGDIDDSRGISIIPCANVGDPSSRFIGIKAKNMHVFYDELSELPIELVEVWRTNLITNRADTPPTLMAASNPKSRTDAFGVMAMPKDGWNSVDIFEEYEWETKDGIYIRFDNTQNPRIKYGREDWSFYTPLDIVQQTIEQYGENSPFVMRFHRATFSDDTEEGSLMSEAEIYGSGADAMPVWGDGELITIAGLDPAYTNGGDQSCLKLAKVGRTVEGLWACAVFRTYLLKSTSDKERMKQRNFDIAQQVGEILRANGVESKYLAVDVTGGTGFIDILAQHVGTDFQTVSFAGMASKVPIGLLQNQEACQQYSNKVSELWGCMKLAINARQLYGLDPTTIVELKSRLYTMNGTRIAVEPKAAMKKRIHKSPDNADALALLVHVCRGIMGPEFGKIRLDIQNHKVVEHQEVIKYREDGTAYIEAADIGRYLGGFVGGNASAPASAPARDTFASDVTAAMNMLWT